MREAFPCTEFVLASGEITHRKHIARMGQHHVNMVSISGGPTGSHKGPSHIENILLQSTCMASVGTKYIHQTLNFAETDIIASQTPGKLPCLTTVHGLPTGSLCFRLKVTL